MSASCLALADGDQSYGSCLSGSLQSIASGQRAIRNSSAAGLACTSGASCPVRGWPLPPGDLEPGWTCSGDLLLSPPGSGEACDGGGGAEARMGVGGAVASRVPTAACMLSQNLPAAQTPKPSQGQQLWRKATPGLGFAGPARRTAPKGGQRRAYGSPILELVGFRDIHRPSAHLQALPSVEQLRLLHPLGAETEEHVKGPARAAAFAITPPRSPLRPVLVRSLTLTVLT